MKLDPNNLTPTQILAITAPIVFVMLFGLSAFTRALDYDGVRAMGPAPHEGLAVQLDSGLYLYDKGGQLANIVDLAELGTETWLGTPAFLASGDLILRTGSHDTGFVQNITNFLRLSQTRPLPEASEGKGLHRCNLTTKKCSPFGRGDFDSSYFALSDPANHRVYFSDASRHSLYLHDDTGTQLAIRDKGFIYPNQLFLHDGKLYVVDTNHQAIQHINTDVNQFGEIITTHQLYEDSDYDGDFVWPYGLAWSGENWWVISHDDMMDKGEIQLYDSDWQMTGILELTGGVRPSAIQRLDDEMIISDLEGSTLMRYRQDGTLIGRFESPELNAALAEQTRQREFWKQLAILSIAAVFIFIAALTYTALRRKHRSAVTHGGSPSEAARQLDDSAIRQVNWIPKKQSLSQSYLAPLVLILLTIPLATTLLILQIDDFSFSSRPTIFLVLLLLLSSGLVYFIWKLSRAELGILENSLVIRDKGSKKAWIGQGSEIIYDGHSITIGPKSIPLNTTSQSLWPLQDTVGRVFPLLTGARFVTPAQRIQIAAQRSNGYMLAAILALATGLAIWLVVSSL